MATPEGGRGDDSRMLAVAAVVAAVLALVVAVGLLFQSSEKAKEREPGSMSTRSSTKMSPTPTITVHRGPATLQSPGPSPVAPQSARMIGDDCSAGGIVAQWDLRDGQWMCVPRGQGRDAHRVGDDCSHDGIVAQWGLSPGGGWLCEPAGDPAPAPAPAPPVVPAPAPQPAPEPEPPVAPEPPPVPPPAPIFVPPLPGFPPPPPPVPAVR
ncbi:hypothetical protein F5X71_06620 [Nocardia brasiliensis]|uniref:Uncharacterized protein n=1 Tax=Nocardia brasiliensis TaxID=37326 RepID=A0A6G9XM60_NOCBR|nr:hypothetical protein [Nocardia brasiliensis]QIS02031.1 hypothetical protein F5X71_06620 [Nocardia brasiliensis]